MANFLFYRYRFEKTVERSLFTSEGHIEVTDEFLNERLAQGLEDMAQRQDKLNLYNFKKDKSGDETSEKYENEILRVDNGIVMLQVRNNKHKMVMPIDKNEAQEIGHYPICWVIIDTRPDSRAILVQQKMDTFSRPDEVIGMIVDYFSRELDLKNLNYKLIYEKRLCVGSIWDIVRTRTSNGQDRVKSLSIKIIGKRAREDNDVDKALQLVLEKLAAPEGELKLTSDDNAQKILDDTKEDVRNTVDMLIDNNYNMKIGFDKSGTVEYGKEAAAVYGISDGVCEEFERGTIVMRDDGSSGYNLEVWLDTLIPEDQNHIYVQAERKKRNGRRSRD